MARWMKRSWLTPWMMLWGRQGSVRVHGDREPTVARPACLPVPASWLCSCPATCQGCLSCCFLPIWAQTSAWPLWGQWPPTPGSLPDQPWSSRDLAESLGHSTSAHPHLDRLSASWSSCHAWASAASTRSTLLLAGEKACIFSSSGIRAPSRLAARCSYSWGQAGSGEPLKLIPFSPPT